MATVGQVAAEVQSYIDEITTLTTSIKNNYPGSSGSSPASGQAITKLKEQAETYDREFEEEQYKRKNSYGGRGRKQTLQEFVLMFFYISFGLLTASLVFYAHATAVPGTGSASTLKIVAGMAFILLVVTAALVRYS